MKAVVSSTRIVTLFTTSGHVNAKVSPRRARELSEIVMSICYLFFCRAEAKTYDGGLHLCVGVPTVRLIFLGWLVAIILIYSGITRGRDIRHINIKINVVVKSLNLGAKAEKNQSPVG